MPCARPCCMHVCACACACACVCSESAGGAKQRLRRLRAEPLKPSRGGEAALLRLLQQRQPPPEQHVPARACLQVAWHRREARARHRADRRVEHRGPLGARARVEHCQRMQPLLLAQRWRRALGHVAAVAAVAAAATAAACIAARRARRRRRTRHCRRGAAAALGRRSSRGLKVKERGQGVVEEVREQQRCRLSGLGLGLGLRSGSPLGAQDYSQGQG